MGFAFDYVGALSAQKYSDKLKHKPNIEMFQ